MGNPEIDSEWGVSVAPTVEGEQTKDLLAVSQGDATVEINAMQSKNDTNNLVWVVLIMLILVILLVALGCCGYCAVLKQ